METQKSIARKKYYLKVISTLIVTALLFFIVPNDGRNELINAYNTFPLRLLLLVIGIPLLINILTEGSNPIPSQNKKIKLYGNRLETFPRFRYSWFNTAKPTETIFLSEIKSIDIKQTWIDKLSNRHSIEIYYGYDEAVTLLNIGGLNSSEANDLVYKINGVKLGQIEPGDEGLSLAHRPSDVAIIGDTTLWGIAKTVLLVLLAAIIAFGLLFLVMPIIYSYQ